LQGRLDLHDPTLLVLKPIVVLRVADIVAPQLWSDRAALPFMHSSSFCSCGLRLALETSLGAPMFCLTIGKVGIGLAMARIQALNVDTKELGDASASTFTAPP
jgi:hypothetical protein